MVRASIAAALGFLAACASSLCAAPPQFAPHGVQFLKTHCLDCHSADEPEADLNLAALTKNEHWVQQRKVADRVLDAIRFGLMPPEGQDRPSVEEIEAFQNRLEGILADADRNAPRNPGRVTMRRLNRVEYNNTVRDLFGIEFRPAENFPSDDVGHGFDNIGDVLTLPPVLMERYLAAAETISEKVLLPNPPAPPKRSIATRYTEPAGKDVPRKRFRPIGNADGLTPIQSGPLFTRYQNLPDGEYIFRSRVYTDAPADRTVRIAVLACSDSMAGQDQADLEDSKLAGAALKGLAPFRIIARLEITARDAKKPQSIKVNLPVMSGLNRMAIAMERPVSKDETHQVFIEHLALEGPLDTRPASHHAIMKCSPDASHEAQTQEIVRRLASRCYRRPATDDEVKRLTQLVLAAEANGRSWEESLQLAIQAVLVSPKFLFRVELQERFQGGDKQASEPLNDFQLASRLSYFLWSSSPDETLYELAREGKLASQLESQTRRMLADPKSEAFIEQFATQWLQIQRLQSHAPDKGAFPQFNDRLRRAMLKETQLFFGAVLREDRSVLDLLQADFTYLNEPLAKHYGIADTHGNRSGAKPQGKRGERIRGDEFVRVQFGKASQRGGLLTQASILTVTSNPTRTSPVKRGRWVLEQLLGTPPPPPPPNVPELEEDGKQLTGTLRERLEQHRAKAACANCHARMDPMGFALEHFDAIGRYREQDGEHTIDSSGKLPGAGDGGAFNGAAELAAMLRQQRASQFKRSLTEKLLTYGLGRGLEYYDRPAINAIVQQLEKHDDKFSALMVAITTSDPFRLRSIQETR